MTRISQITKNQTLVLLTSNEQAGLANFVERLHQRYGADLLLAVLYGSKARGDSDNESDLDVLIVVQMPDNDYWQYWNEIVDIAWEIELAYSLVISLIIKSERDYTLMCEHQSLLARNIERDGIKLWTTSPNAPTSTPI